MNGYVKLFWMLCPYLFLFGASAVMAFFWAPIPVSPRFTVNFFVFSMAFLLYMMKREFDEFQERLNEEVMFR